MRGEIDRERAFPDVVRHRLGRRIECDARIVHDDVEMPEMPERGIHDAIGGVIVAEIFFQTSDARDAGMRARKRLVGQIDRQDLRALIGKKASRRAANARGRARHNGDTVFEAHGCKSRCFAREPSRDPGTSAMARMRQNPTKCASLGCRSKGQLASGDESTTSLMQWPGHSARSGVERRIDFL